MGRAFLTSSFFSVANIISRMLHDEQRGKDVLFITTAAEVEAGEKKWLTQDRESLIAMGLNPIEYSITAKTSSDIKKKLSDFRYIFLSGGNSFYLLEKMQQSGFAELISDFMKIPSSVYFGSSAGSAVAGSTILPLAKLDDPQKAPNLEGHKGLNFVDICLFPHWGSEAFRKNYLPDGLDLAYQEDCKVILLRDNQFLDVNGSGEYRIVSS